MKKVKIFIVLCILGIIFQVQPSAAKTGKVILNKTNIKLKKGNSFQLKLKNCRSKVKWSTSDVKIVSVSNKGKIRGKRTGTAIVKAKTGKNTYKCKVRVYSKETTVNMKYNNDVFTKKTLSYIKEIHWGKDVVSDKSSIKKIYSKFSALKFQSTDTPRGIFANSENTPVEEMKDGILTPVRFILKDNRQITAEFSSGQVRIQKGSINEMGNLQVTSNQLYDIQNWIGNAFFESIEKLFKSYSTFD